LYDVYKEHIFIAVSTSVYSWQFMKPKDSLT